MEEGCQGFPTWVKKGFWLRNNLHKTSSKRLKNGCGDFSVTVLQRVEKRGHRGFCMQPARNINLISYWLACSPLRDGFWGSWGGIFVWDLFSRWLYFNNYWRGNLEWAAGLLFLFFFSSSSHKQIVPVVQNLPGNQIIGEPLGIVWGGLSEYLSSWNR